MGLIKGIQYNIRGLAMGLKTPRLLLLGLIRFIGVIVITVASASLILVYHQALLNFMWSKPESSWALWLWVLLSAVLLGLSAVLSYLISQILISFGFWASFFDSISQYSVSLVCPRRCNPLLYRSEQIGGNYSGN